MIDRDDDALLTELRALPTKDVEPATAERIGRVAAGVLVESKADEGHPWRAGLTRATRALTPIVIAGTVGVYLAWAVSAANALFP